MSMTCIRRIASDRFLIMMNQIALQQLEQSRFAILDEFREMVHEVKIPFTLSIGIATQAGSLTELGTQAQASLDIALGRGGDQVAREKRQASHIPWWQVKRCREKNASESEGYLPCIARFN